MSSFKLFWSTFIGFSNIKNTEHFHPNSVLHIDEHPSLFYVLPSSHCLSFVNLTPVPHFSLHSYPLDDFIKL